VKTVWIVVSALCGAAAVFFVVREDYDKMFIAATVGAVAWFLSYRVSLREKLDEDETEDQEA
jgi:uncharacterized membrane protein YdjX (TVP38/TMEM64 family)